MGGKGEEAGRGREDGWGQNKRDRQVGKGAMAGRKRRNKGGRGGGGRGKETPGQVEDRGGCAGRRGRRLWLLWLLPLLVWTKSVVFEGRRF